MPSAVSAPRSAGRASGAGSKSNAPSTIRKAGARQREGRRRTRPRGARPTARLRAERRPARSRQRMRCRRCSRATVDDEAGQRQRGQHMRALIAAGARQETGDQNRRDQPGEDRDFQRARHAAHRKIDRERGERDQAAEQPRRDEGAMARARQRIMPRRRMHQRIEIIADGTQNTHVTHCRPSSTDAHSPYSSPDRVRAHLSER